MTIAFFKSWNFAFEITRIFKRMSAIRNGGRISESEDDRAPEEGEIVSLGDVIREREILEQDAVAVLGGSDDKNCTYDQGYIYRQALYSCLTCVPKSAQEPAGVCLACGLKCHDGHELVELYTKRNFRCDCGNGKFGNSVCQLQPNKDGSNEKNKYNHNFLGEYCICNRPYPDPEDNVEDEMIQCAVCEDWFHGRHLDTAVPSEDEFSEMVCQLCINRCPFLRTYGYEATDGSRNATNGSLNESALETSINDEISSSADIGKEPHQTECKYFNMTNLVSRKGAVFFADGWREQLCRCEKCLEMYEAHNCSFLTDSNDTVKHYEEMGKHDESCNTIEKGMRLFNQQDRVTQIEFAHGYNEFKEKLTEYLKPFAESGKVVEKADIDAFFSSHLPKKRPRLTITDTCTSSYENGEH